MLVPDLGTESPVSGRLLAILWVRRGLRDAVQFSVRGPGATIGRDPDNAVVIDSPAVSAHHAVLSLSGGIWTLTDLGSINGSWVDGERVEQPLPLAPGSELRIADVVLAFAPRDEWGDSPLAAGVDDDAAPVISSPLFLPQDDHAGPRRFLIRGAVVLGLGFLAYLLLATH